MALYQINRRRSPTRPEQLQAAPYNRVLAGLP